MSAESGKAQPVAYLISSPSEPDIGSWLSEKPATVDWLTSQPLYPHPDPVRAALVEALEGLASAYEKLPGAQTAQGSWHSHAIAALKAAGVVL